MGMGKCNWDFPFTGITFIALPFVDWFEPNFIDYANRLFFNLTNGWNINKNTLDTDSYCCFTIVWKVLNNVLVSGSKKSLTIITDFMDIPK